MPGGSRIRRTPPRGCDSLAGALKKRRGESHSSPGKSAQDHRSEAPADPRHLQSGVGKQLGLRRRSPKRNSTYMTKELKPLLVPELIWLAEIGGEPVGFILCVPDINVALQENQRPPDDLRFADRAGEIALLQEPDQNGAPRRARRGAEISPARDRGDAGAPDHRGSDAQARIHRRMQPDPGKQLHDESFSRGDRRGEIQDLSDLSAPACAGAMNLRRVLILADESADWIVAGLRQFDRLALSIDEFAVENNETAPVLVSIFWRDDSRSIPALDPGQSATHQDRFHDRSRWPALRSHSEHAAVSLSESDCGVYSKT